MKGLFCVALLVVVHFAVATDASAQSSAASLSGIVRDEQHGSLGGATIVARGVGTGFRRTTTSNQNGTFRLIGLVPGRYELTTDLTGFKSAVEHIDLTVNEQRELTVTLHLATIAQTVEVQPLIPLLDSSQTEIGRTLRTKQVDELPIAERNVANLALLTAGMVANQLASGSSTPVATAAQTGRNNTFLLDGLTLDTTGSSASRPAGSLDAIAEVAVLSNGFSAEYGRASGAIVSIVTRSGSNRLAGRGYYYHRDRRWDAAPHAARLTDPPAETAAFSQKSPGMSVGGPIVQNRAFYFASAEYILVNSENIVTSPVLPFFRPGLPNHQPVESRSGQLMIRTDHVLDPSNTLTVRYRHQPGTTTAMIAPGANDVGLNAPERAFDVVTTADDVAVQHNLTLRNRSVNEARFQWIRGGFDRDATAYCGGCPSIERPSIRLGKLSSVPNSGTEYRWQFADSFTRVLRSPAGEHTVKAGIDVSVIGIDSRQLTDGDGSFVFTTDLPFDPDLADTYPTQYTQSFGTSHVQLHHATYAAFAQDQWKPHANLTVNAGVRWDYDDALGASADTRDVAPRLAVSFDPTGRGVTSFRGGWGRYYDQVPLTIVTNAVQAQRTAQLIIANPGFPDPFGQSPKVPARRPQNTTVLTELQTPYSDQVTAGIQQALSPHIVLSADVVRARGHNLPVTRDLNYLDLLAPGHPRPNPLFQMIQTVESRGNSWYTGLQSALEKGHSARHSYTVAYTLSTAERDTEDFTFVPQDQHAFAAERGPAANDVRHRLAASLNLDIPADLRLTTVVIAQTALPYTITTGTDDNHDGNRNDRPIRLGRNSARGAPFVELDVRLSKTVHIGRTSTEVLGEAYNLTNRANWTGFDGRQTSKTFGHPTSALRSRQVQVGIRLSL
jgi:hypothetical protein